jgi:hypothetical protein
MNGLLIIAETTRSLGGRLRKLREIVKEQCCGYRCDIESKIGFKIVFTGYILKRLPFYYPYTVITIIPFA